MCCWQQLLHLLYIYTAKLHGVDMLFQSTRARLHCAVLSSLYWRGCFGFSRLCMWCLTLSVWFRGACLKVLVNITAAGNIALADQLAAGCAALTVVSYVRLQTYNSMAYGCWHARVACKPFTAVKP
jgi:hypothetical protein